MKDGKIVYNKEPDTPVRALVLEEAKKKLIASEGWSESKEKKPPTIKQVIALK